MEERTSKRESDLQLPASKTKTKPTWLLDSALPGSAQIDSMMRQTRASPVPLPLLQHSPPRLKPLHRASFKDAEHCCT
jgi:hypothetical protein